MNHFDNIGAIATIPDCARQLGMTPSGLYLRMQIHSGMSRPDTFKAGNAQVMFKDNALIWIEKHKAEWEAIQAAKKGGA